MSRRALVLWIVVAVVAVGIGGRFPSPAFAGPPRGPVFGNNRFRTQIGAYASDVDDYIAPLVRGESLSVVVAADPRSKLRPRVTVLDPDGVDRTPETVTRRHGSMIAFRSLAIDATGTWVVRVASRDGTTGAYTARFAVRPARATVARRQRLRQRALEREHSVEAVDGSFLHVSLGLVKGRPLRPAVTIAGPGGDPVPLPAPRRRGAVMTWTGVPLTAGDGAYRISVGIDEGDVTYDLRLAARPPARPRGTIVLTPLEPRLALHGVPERIAAGQPYLLHGTNFSIGREPRVWFGDAPATVFGVQGAGGRISVFPPLLPEDTVADVTVANPDGQAVTARAHVVSVTGVPPAVARLEPGSASVYVGGLIRYTLTLARPAPAAGATIALAADAGLGFVPSEVSVPARAQAVHFDFIASGAVAAGRVAANLGGVWKTATVSIVALPVPDDGGSSGEPPPPASLPDEIDVSNWVVRQQNSSRDFTIPAGTKLYQGGYVVIGRAATRAAFEAYWGVTLANDVWYFNGDGSPSSNSDDWPSVNGGETYELRDASGNRVDGPSAAMSAAAGENWQRIAGAAAGIASSWTVTTTIAPGGAPTPGSGQPTDQGKHGVHISEFSDAAQGASSYEFVELHFDGHP